ncbi:MAG: hypothetical protein WD423_07035 [Rhodothermales bacterium]
MKNFLRYAACLMALVPAATPAMGQHHLFGEDVGGYVGPVVKLSNIDRTPAFFMGARAGMTLGIAEEARLSVGAAMYGMMNGVRVVNRDYLQFGYGGLDLEYAWRPDEILYFSIRALIGAGTADADSEVRRRVSHMWTNGPALFVAEPGIGLTLNAAPGLRLGGAVTYRNVGGSAITSLRGARLSGWSGQLELIWGRH